jgi:hypothetical protein
MKKYYKFLLIFILVCTGSIVEAQILPMVQNSFKNYYMNVFEEKLFVHTDKEVYVNGELLWFKLYNVDATTNQPINLSKVAYVEILDFKNNPVLQAKVALKSGSGNGSMFIPVTISSGNYKLRAYTNWMQNAGSALFFEKQITLINPHQAPEKKARNKDNPDLQFFPEGGDLVNGIPSNVGFKANSTDGKGLNIKGVVINQQNDTVAKFQSLKFGIGRFVFTPLANQTYKAIAISEKGEVLIKELPKTKPNGYATMLTVNENNMTVTVGTNVGNTKVYLVVHSGKTISITQAAELLNGKASFQFSKERLSDGINYLTLFNEKGLPVSERLFFKKPIKKLNLEAYSDYVQYNSRKRVTVNISAKNEKQEPQLTDISISVHRLDSLQALNENNISSYLLLQSELKGNIESPNFYFTENSERSEQALDNLLLTQGWRRFNWNEVLENKAPILKFLPEYNGHIINGLAVNLNGTPAKNTKIYLSLPAKKNQFYGTETDSTGNFRINTKNFYGVNELVLQTNYLLDSTSTISIKTPFSQQFNLFNYPELEIKSEALGALTAYNIGAQVQNFYASAKLKQFYDPGVDSSSFYGIPYKIYKLDDYTRFASMEEVLREYVREVVVSKKQKNFHLAILSDSKLLSGDPLVLLDGVPYFNMDKVMALNPTKIKKLEVINYPYFYASSLFDGVLSFSSFQGNLADIPLDKRAVVIDYEGMQLQREFYSPLYEMPEQINSRIPDFRNLLHWSPQIITDKAGNGKVNFYTSDQLGTYIGIVNGITANGIPGSKTFIFEVKK